MKLKLQRILGYTKCTSEPAKCRHAECTSVEAFEMKKIAGNGKNFLLWLKIHVKRKEDNFKGRTCNK